MTTGQRIIITREQERGRPWAEQLRAQGRPVLELPLLRFVPVEPDPALVGLDFDWILFTSPQGVRAFFEAGLPVGQARLGTLSDGTAQALTAAGHRDDLGIRALDGRELAQAFAAQASPGARVLLPGPRRRGSDIAGILTETGCRVTEAVLYETLPVPAPELPDAPFAEDDVVLFCSPSAVRAFCAKWDTRPAVVAIGETTAAVTRQEGFATQVAQAPDLDAMIRAISPDPHASPNTRENRS